MTTISWPLTRTEAALPDAASDLVSDGGATIFPGGRAAFPQGYEVTLVAVTQAVRTGDEWDMFGGPWWRPDGTPVAPQSGGMDGHWHWTVAHTHDLPPFLFKVAFRAPRSAWRHGESSAPGFFEQFPGTLKPNERAIEEHVMTRGPHPTDRLITSPLIDGAAPQFFGGNVGGTRCAELYPPGTRTCTVRCGVATGQWRTVAARPFTLTPASVTPDASQSARYATDVSLTLDDRPREVYRDARGTQHVFYFLRETARLSNVARRFVAVDAAGRIIPLKESPTGAGSPGIGMAFGRKSEVNSWNPTVDLTRVREFYLQTCPYQTVEFRNVRLQPDLAPGGTQDAAAALLAQASATQLAQARQLRAHLQNWAEVNKALLQKMAQAQPNDLPALIQVYDALVRLPFPLWGDDPRLSHDSEDPPFAIELPSRLTLAHLQRSQDLVETRMRRDFTQFHDLAVAQSVNVGRSHLTVWASGRITQTTATDRFQGHRQPIGTEESHQEIVPAFFGTDRVGDTVTTAETPKAKTPQLPINSSALTFRGHPVIVVDPGHGGQDTGAVGAGGVMEKSLNLEIAQKLRTELVRRGAVVFLTRDGDTYLPSTERLRRAAQRHADYFVSLHCDVWTARPDQVGRYPTTGGTGTRVYYHGQGPKEHLLAQSISLLIGQATDLSPNLVASDATRFLSGFYVLREAHMPAVLVECGYMNNLQEMIRLQNPRKQQQLAQGIAAGLAVIQVQG